MMIGIPFLCNNGVRGSNDSSNTFCFHPDAVCVRNDPSVGDFCVCPEGFIPDLLGGRFLNCALPRWFLPSMFALMSLGSIGVLSLVLSDVLLRLKSTLRKAVLFYLIGLIAAWIHVLCAVIQEAVLVPGLVFLAIQPPALMTFAYLMLKIVLDPICLSIGGSRFEYRKRVIRYTYALFLFGIASLNLAEMALADVTDRTKRETFNFVFSLHMFVTGSAYPVFGCLVYLQTRQLMQTIDLLDTGSRSGGERLNKSRRGEFTQQLKHVQTIGWTSSLNCIPMFIAGIVLCVFGSIPYQFVFWSLNMLGTIPMGLVLRKSFKKRQRKRQSETSKGSKMVAAEEDGRSTATSKEIGPVTM